MLSPWVDNLNIRDTSGSIASHTAVEGDNYELVAMLLQAGADPDG